MPNNVEAGCRVIRTLTFLILLCCFHSSVYLFYELPSEMSGMGFTQDTSSICFK